MMLMNENNNSMINNTNNNINNNQSLSISSNSSNCLVCGDSALTRHFGSLCCNACAAFFRRSVAGKRRYSCTKEGNCTIVYGSLKRLCRHCRYLKCLESGMRENEVQSCNGGSATTLPPSPPSPPKPPKFSPKTFDIVAKKEDPPVTSLLIALDKILAAYFSAKMLHPILDCQQFIPLSPSIFEKWILQQKEKLEIYLTKMEINIHEQYFVCRQQISSLWITMAMIQTTIERNGHKDRKIKFENGIYLDISLNGIKDAFGFRLDDMGDGFMMGSLMKAFTSIFDLSCLSVQCNLTFVDLVFALHLAILFSAIQSLSPSHPSNEQLNSLNTEMEIFYQNSGEKLTALRFITNQLSHFTVDFEIIVQALKSKLQKSMF